MRTPTRSARTRPRLPAVPVPAITLPTNNLSRSSQAPAIRLRVPGASPRLPGTSSRVRATRAAAELPDTSLPVTPGPARVPAVGRVSGCLSESAEISGRRFPQSPAAAAERTGIPKQVKNAYLLFLAGAALNLLASLINIVLTGSQYSAVRTGASVVGFIFAIIFAAIWVWFALLMKEGVGWARIVLIVLAALSVISGLVSLVGTLFLGTSLINLLASIAFVAGGVMLLLPGSVAYFNARRAQRFS